MPGERATEQRFLHSVGTRLALATALLVLLVAGAIYYALLRYERQSLLHAKRDAAVTVAALFSELLSAPVVFGDGQGIRESLGYMRSNNEIDEAAVFAITPDGQLGEALGTISLTNKPPRLRAPVAADVGKTQETHETLDISQWVRDPASQRVAAVVVRFSLARENLSFELLGRRMLQISTGLASLLTLLLLLLARVYIISPLRTVRGAVRDLSAGAPSHARRALPLQARDEIGDLARGFVSMADAIERREAAIATQNREMRLVLDSVGEGFLVLDAAGAIVGQHSAVLETWFGPVPHGRKLWDYLRAHDPEQAEWLELTWSNIGAPFMPLSLCLEQTPKAFVAGARHYAVEYRPLLDDDRALQTMVVVISDVSELRRREQAESEQRELVAVFTALIRDRTGFVSFCEDAKQLIKSIAQPSVEAESALLEQLHTIKGNAHLFRLREFAEACERLEAACASEQRAPSTADAGPLTEAFQKSVRPVELFVATDYANTVQLSTRDYAALVQALQAHETPAQLLARLSHATAEPADLVFARFSERLQVLARRLGKCPTRVLCDGHGVRFPRQTFAPLWSATVHVLRNIADHGLETAWEREQAHKPTQATVFITARTDETRLELSFRDDGRGIDWERVRARARAQGLAAETSAELVTALLGHGFSTLQEPTALSGRGVGLAALHSEVSALGGTLQLDSVPGHGTTLVIHLPVALVAA